MQTGILDRRANRGEPISTLTLLGLVALVGGAGCAHGAAVTTTAEPPAAGDAAPATAAPATAAPATPAPATPAEGHLVPGKEVPTVDAGERIVVRERHSGLGGRVEIVGATEREAEARAAIAEAIAEIGRIETLTSDQAAGSEVAKINAAAGQPEPVAISPELLTILWTAREVSELSGGAFDVTWAALRGLWSFDADPPVVPGDEEITQRVQRIGYQHLILTREPATARLAIPGAAIGLGGIAKGYAVDRAAKILKTKGFLDFIVYAGGDLYTSGQKAPDRPWTVGVQHPRVPGALISVFPAPGGSIVTSGDYEQYFVKDGVRYHHIIDTKTGRPATGSMAVTVLSADPVLADALCTALFVLGPERGLELARKAPGVEAILIDPQGQPHLTDGLRDKIRVEPVALP